jgi:hypothetical protein
MMTSYIFIVPQRGLLRNANKNTTIKQDNAEGDSPPRAGGGGGPWRTRARPPWRTVGRPLRKQKDNDDNNNNANVDRRTKRVAPGSHGDDGNDGGMTSPMTTTMTVMARGTNRHAEGGTDCATTRATMDQGIIWTINIGGGKENVAPGKINRR